MKTFLIATVALFLLAGCFTKSVVGKWNYEALGLNITLDLKEDMSFAMGTPSTGTQAGTYVFEDGKVKLKFGSAEAENMVLTLSDDGETLNGSIGIVNIALKRAE